MPASEPSASPVSAPADWRSLLTPTELAEYEKRGDAYRTDVALHRDRPPARERRALPGTERLPDRNGTRRTLPARPDRPQRGVPTVPVVDSNGELAARQTAYYVGEAMRLLAQAAAQSEPCRECGAAVGARFAAVLSMADEPRAQVFCAKCSAKLPRQPLRDLAVPLPALCFRSVGALDAATVEQIAAWASEGATDAGIVGLLALRGVTATARQVKSARQAIRRLRATRRAA